MVGSNPNSSNDGGDNSLPLKNEGGPGVSAPESGKFKKLAEAQKRRNEFIVLGRGWLGRAAVVLVLVAAGAGMFQLLDTTETDLVTDDVLSGTLEHVTVAFECDEAEGYNAVPGHPCTLKTQFQAKHRELSTQYLPNIEASADEAFVQTDLGRIQEFEGEAIKAFDRSDFGGAVTAVDKALESAKLLTDAIAEKFRSSFNNAEAAFRNNNPETAREWIDGALRLNGQDAAANSLFDRIAALPDVLRLSQKASEAEVQNQLLALKGYLQQIVQLDPERQGVADQLAKLQVQLKQASYNAYLRQASKYIDSGDTRSARHEVNKATAIYSGRQDTSALLSQINEIERTRRIGVMLTDAQALESQDNWPSALGQYDNILAEDNTNRLAINGREKANKVIFANKRLVNILNRQNRLQDAAVRQRHSEFIDQIRPLSEDSETLANTISTLEQRLALWQQKVKVTVRSDGKSKISVRRVGHVGVIKQKDILLRPGKYDFECSRKGYKSKIIEHIVPPGQNGTSLTITCDVRV